MRDAGSGFAAYLAIFGLADAIVPIFPEETTLNAACVLASHDKLELELVIIAGALGAVLGDSSLIQDRPHRPKGAKGAHARRHRRGTSTSRRDHDTRRADAVSASARSD